MIPTAKKTIDYMFELSLDIPRDGSVNPHNVVDNIYRTIMSRLAGRGLTGTFTSTGCDDHDIKYLSDQRRDGIGSVSGSDSPLTQPQQRNELLARN